MRSCTQMPMRSGSHYQWSLPLQAAPLQLTGLQYSWVVFRGLLSGTFVISSPPPWHPENTTMQVQQALGPNLTLAVSATSLLTPSTTRSAWVGSHGRRQNYVPHTDFGRSTGTFRSYCAPSAVTATGSKVLPLSSFEIKSKVVQLNEHLCKLNL